MDLAFAGDLIPAAGMSSSSAVIVAIFLAMSAVNDLKTTPAYRKNIHDQFELAEYLGTVENGQSYRGNGTSQDIVEAAARAYLEVINRILRRRERGLTDVQIKSGINQASI